jgi:hypothetical protein
MNAAERYWAASKARDVSAAVSELSRACDEFRHTHLLADDQGQLFGLVFEAKVGEETLRGVDLIELDDRDRISTITVCARPMKALMALGARMGQSPGRG